MYNLFDFEGMVSNTILKRGRDYYEQGLVKNIVKLGDYAYEVDVEGSDDYIVEIELNKLSVIKDYSCDCPYDGDFCKHIVAALYQLRDELTIEVKEDKQKKSKKLTLNELLEKTSIEELREFILLSAKKDTKFKLSVETYFADKDDSIDIGEKHREVFKKIIKEYSSHGFVDYSNAKKLSKELEVYLDRIKGLIAQNNYRDASSIIQAFIIETIHIIECADDSNGYVGDMISSAIEVLDAIIEGNTAIELKEALIPFFEKELAKEIYFDYGDFGYELLDSFELLCLKIFKEDYFLTYLEHKIKRLSSDSYKRSHLTNVKLSLLGKLGREEQLNEEILENLSIPDVRRGLVQRKIKEGKYVEAKTLLAEGIKIANKLEHPGTVRQWEGLLLEIAELENDIETMRHFYNKEVFDGRSINRTYYSKLKATFKKDEWKEIIEAKVNDLIKKALDQRKGYGPYSYNAYNGLVSSVGLIYSLEGYVDRLFELLKNVSQLDIILPYLKDIKNEYSVDDIFAILTPLVIKETDKASSRSHYKNIGSKLIYLKKQFPLANNIIDTLVESLCKKYPRRPAMLDEFKKV